MKLLNNDRKLEGFHPGATPFQLTGANKDERLSISLRYLTSFVSKSTYFDPWWAEGNQSLEIAFFQLHQTGEIGFVSTTLVFWEWFVLKIVFVFGSASVL